MEKFNLKKELKHLYQPSAKGAQLVKVPPFHFLMVDGSGDPNQSALFQNAVETLFSLSPTP